MVNGIATMDVKVLCGVGGYMANELSNKIIKHESAGRIHYWTDDEYLQYHRTNGPAYIFKSSDTWEWWLYGKNHRYYGPTITNGNWAIHGKWVK